MRVLSAECRLENYDRENSLGDSKEKPPFLLTLLTATNHDPFLNIGNYPPNPEGTGRRQLIHNSMKYVDESFGHFFEQTQRLDLFKDTIWILVGDHPPFSPETWPPEQEYLKAPIVQAWLPLVIIPSEGLRDVIPKEAEDWVVSQIDIAPTILDLMGLLPKEHHFLGNSLLDRSVNPADRFAFVRNNPKQEYYWITRDWFLTDSYDEKSSSLFFLKEDPWLQVDQIQSHSSEASDFRRKLRSTKFVNDDAQKRALVMPEAAAPR
ncbi:sulfatase-like hydrolase/transferase [Bdellovibrionota bacterium FG-2]